MDTTRTADAELLGTGVPGLDDVLMGGLEPHRMYLVEGTPGSGKTTLALQLLREGVRSRRCGLYITLSETEHELRGVASSHGWSLDGIEIVQTVTDEGLDPGADQSVLHPSELELGETTQGVIAKVMASRPHLVVFDSLSELRLLAQSPLRYRRQVLALKHFFTKATDCTVFLLDDRTSDRDDLQLHSIAHGVLSLEQVPLDFGAERRRLRVVKMRAKPFRGGYHDYIIQAGGLNVFPRLVADEQHGALPEAKVSSGNVAFDKMLGGGLTRGSNILLVGPAGTGKTTTSTSALVAALRRGERGGYFLFDEGTGTLLARSAALGLDLRPFVESGQLTLQQIDPAEMSPGEFAVRVRRVVQGGAGTIVIDGLNGYLQSMPGERFLILQMQELLGYLSQVGVVTIMILGQHGMAGELPSNLDLSFLADAVVLLRYFEVDGVVRKAMSVLKTRCSLNERTIREFMVDAGGLTVGLPLRGFEGVLTGTPLWSGAASDLLPGVADYQDH